MTSTKQVLNIFLATCTSIAISGCNSKFSESSPKSIEIKGTPLDERVSQKEKIDLQIDEVYKSVQKLIKVVELFKKIQSPSSIKDVYTPLDFLLELNNDLKTKIPENKEDKLVRYGKVIVPVDGLSPECKTIETQLETQNIYEDSTDSGKIIGEKLIYSLKTCSSENRFIQTIEATSVENNIEVKFDKKNLKTLFTGIVLSKLAEQSTCDIELDERKIISSATCENLDVQLSQSEKAVIKSMLFRSEEEVKFRALADIYENKALKAISDITVFKDGQFQFDIKEVTSSTPPAE